jgi:gluconokinase
MVIMGVSGSGKTTIGEKLAAELGWSFRDADDFHPPANVAKMAAGTPLDDRDRAPWLAAIRTHIDESLARRESTIVTCSALKERYREKLVGDPERVTLIHLVGDFELIRQRMKRRTDHFFKPELLRSQFETLEPPDDAMVINIDQSPDAIVTEIRRKLGV